MFFDNITMHLSRIQEKEIVSTKRDETKLKGPAPKCPETYKVCKMNSELRNVQGENSKIRTVNTGKNHEFISKPFNFQHIAHIGLSDRLDFGLGNDTKFKVN